MCDWCCTIAALRSEYGLYTIEFTVVLLAFEGAYHLLNKVVDVEKFHIDGRVINDDREVIGDVVAESRYDRVVVRTTPLPIEVRETIDKNLSTCLFPILEH